MKKIISIISTMVLVAAVSAQKKMELPTKSLSVAEANAQNGNKEAMKDGKPYSQWVAEEKAKQATERNKQNPSPDNIAVIAYSPNEPDRSSASNDPSSKQSPSNIVTTETRKGPDIIVKENSTPAESVSIPEKKQTQPTHPGIPEHLKLANTNTWNNPPVVPRSNNRAEGDKVPDLQMSPAQKTSVTAVPHKKPDLNAIANGTEVTLSNKGTDKTPNQVSGINPANEQQAADPSSKQSKTPVNKEAGKKQKIKQE
jgi:hypothetical protein